MTHTTLKAIAVSALLATAIFAPLLAGSAAEAAGKGKEFFVQEYTFDKPMNGYQGFSGAYYCSFVKQPKEVCVKGKCKTVWSLVQSCQ